MNREIVQRVQISKQIKEDLIKALDKGNTTKYDNWDAMSNRLHELMDITNSAIYERSKAFESVIEKINVTNAQITGRVILDSQLEELLEKSFSLQHDIMNDMKILG